MMDNKLLTGIIINVLVITFVLIIFLGPTIQFESNDDTNITLIKEHTHGYVFVNNGSDPYYNYYVDGVLLNLPSNVEGYDLKTNFYDENGKNVHESKGNLEILEQHSKKSDPYGMGSWQTQDPHNISNVEIIIVNPTGGIVYNQTLKFDMEKFDYSRLNHK